MSISSIWRRNGAEPREYVSPPMEPHETMESLADAVRPQPFTVEFTDKPMDLVRAAAQEWTRPIRAEVAAPEPPPSLTVPWQTAPPMQAGLYWYREVEHGGVVHLCVVVDFGRLCVAERRGNSCTWRAVSSLSREWAGPICAPDGVALELLA